MRGRKSGIAGYIFAGLLLLGCTSGNRAGETVRASAQADATSCPNAFQFGGTTWCAVTMGDTLGQPVTGQWSVAADSISLTSNGDGVVRSGDPDENTDDDGVLFVYTRVPHTTDGLGAPRPEDIEVAVHVTPAAGNPRLSQMGVMIRDDTAGKALMAAGFYEPETAESCTTSDDNLGVVRVSTRSQVPNQAPAMGGGGGRTRVGDSFWLRLQRVGRDFLFQRSNDGAVWTGNIGGELVSNDALVGIFVSGQVQNASATFDDIYVGAPHLDHRTSWIGSSFGKQSTDFVSFGMHDMYVAPDGTTYKYSQAAEGNHSLNVIEATGTLRKLPVGNLTTFGFYQGGIAGDPSTEQIYLATRTSAEPCAPGSRVERRQMADLSPASQPFVDFGQPTLGLIGGLAASHGRVYLSDVAVNEQKEQGLCPYRSPPLAPTRNSTIRIQDAQNPNSPTKFDFTDQTGAPATPGALAADDGGDIWVVQEATDYPVLDLGTCLNVNEDKTQCPDPPGSCYPPGSYRYFCPCSVERSRYPGNFQIKRPGVIQCLHADGSRCGGASPLEITAAALGYPAGTPFNPVGVTIDPGPTSSASDDRLLIADNGPRQSILICTSLHGTLACSDYGPAGGLFSGSTPGLVNDPAAGGWKRFFSPLKAAVDGQGDVYVASSAPQVDIRKFTPSGTLAWGLFGLLPESGSFDPDTDGHDYYTMTKHFSFDPSQTEAGKEWGFKAVTVSPFDGATLGDRYGDALAPGGLAMLMRRLTPPGGGRSRFLYQIMNTGELRFYRFATDTSEIAVPFGSLHYQPVRDGDSCNEAIPDIPGCLRLWIDRDGDGVEDRGTDPDPCKPCDGFSGTCEVETMPSSSLPPGLPVAEVDDNGHLWLGWAGSTWELTPSFQSGASFPSYALASATSKTLPSPASGTLQLHYDSASGSDDTMYLFGAKPGLADGCQGSSSDPCWCAYGTSQVLRFDHWHTTPVLAPGYPIVLPAPQQNVDRPDEFAMRFADLECTTCISEGYTNLGFDVAGNLLFVQRRMGEVLVYDTGTTAKVTTLWPGPEIGGDQYWTDLPQGLRAFKRSNGEYLVTRTNSSNQARTLVYRYTPPTTSTWSPALLSPAAWYVAGPNDISVQSGRVAQWVDHSGHGQTLVNNFEPGRPVYDATGWNGKPTVTFNGAALLRRDSWSGSPEGTNQPFSVLAVVKTQQTSADGALLAWWDSNVGHDVRCNFKIAGSENRLDITRGEGWASDQAFTSPTSILPGTSHIVVWRFSPDTFTLTVDGTTQSSVAQAPVGPLSFDTLVMGAKTTLPTGLFQGSVSELVVVPAFVSDTDVTAFHDYAELAWGPVP